MFIKLNFTSPQPPSVFFESVYLCMNQNITSASNFRTVARTNAASSALQAICADSGSFNVTNSEIINTSITPGTMPYVYYFSGGASPAPASSQLTIKFITHDASSTFGWLQINPTTFQVANGSGWTLTSNSSNGSSATNPYSTLAGVYSAANTWNPATPTAYTYWASISPNAFVWDSTRSAYYKQGWPMVYGSYPNTAKSGPFMVSQYTRLDVWNTNDNSILPYCWINGYSASYRGQYYGLSYGSVGSTGTFTGGNGDLRWDTTLNFSQNPSIGSPQSPTFNTTFSVFNTINATPNTTGTWNNTEYLASAPSAGVSVTYGTHIRSFQDQAALVRSSDTTFNTTNFGYVYNKATYTENAVVRSAWYGTQGASLYDFTHQSGAYLRWPNSESPAKGSFVLQPLVWNRADYNNIGGLISDKAGVYLFNGDYTAGDEFTANSITYSIWPLADCWSQRIGLAVPKQ